MKTELMSRSGRKPRRFVLNGVAITALAGIGVAALTFGSAPAASSQPPIPTGYALSSWQDNGANGTYLLEVTDGQLPVADGAVTGLVLSDSNCMADDQGLSHCVNEIQFADGSVLTVIDNHNMGENRCLQPGETIALSPYDEFWVIALTDNARG